MAPERPAPGADAAAALELIKHGRSVQALDRLLALWAVMRAPEVADRIDLLSQQIDRSLEPITARDGDAWLGIAGARRSADIGRLMAALTTNNRATRRKGLELLERFPPDPRVALALAQTVGAMPNAHPWKPAHNTTHRLLVAANDPRTGAPLRAALRDLPARIVKGARELTSGGKWVGARIERTLAKLVDPPPLPVGELRVLEQIERQIRELLGRPAPSEEALWAAAPPPARAAGEDRGQQLLDAIHADPERDELRLVYADWLAERGDPRGELIMLQYKRLERGLGSAEQRRERELVKQHWANWTRPLDMVLAPGKLSFERGFLAACEAELTTEHQRELITHPVWATVTDLICNDMVLVTNPALRSLRRASVRDGRTLSELARREAPVPLRTAVGWRRPHWTPERWCPSGVSLQRWGEGEILVDDREEWTDALAVGALTSLRELSVELPVDNMEGDDHDVAAKDLRWLWDSPLGRQLEVLQLVQDESDKVNWAEWVAVMKELPRLERLAFHHFRTEGQGRHGDLVFCIERQGVGLHGRLQLQSKRWHRGLRVIEDSVEGFPSARLASLTVECAWSPADYEVKRIQRWLRFLKKRFKRLEGRRDPTLSLVL